MDPFSLLISLSRYYDLVIFGLKSIFDYGLVREPENALTKFVREGVRPILAIGKDFEPMKRVLIAYSGSMHSAKAMKHFVQLRLWPHMKIKIIVLGKSKKDAQDLLRGASEYCKNHGLRTELEHVPASGKEQLIKQAKKWNADLIVMGNSMRNLFLRQTLGDIALHTIQHSNKTLFLSQ